MDLDEQWMASDRWALSEALGRFRWRLRRQREQLLRVSGNESARWGSDRTPGIEFEQRQGNRQLPLGCSCFSTMGRGDVRGACLSRVRRLVSSTRRTSGSRGIAICIGFGFS